MKNTLKRFIPVLVFLCILLPLVSLAQVQGGAPTPAPSGPGNIIPCGTKSSPTPCNFDLLLKMVNGIVYFILVYLSVPIAAIMFAYAGILLITAGEHSEHARSEAKEIFMNTVIGVCFVAGAWIIIHSISMILGYDGSWIGF